MRAGKVKPRNRPYYPFGKWLEFIGCKFSEIFSSLLMKYVANIITVNFRRQLMNKYLQMNISFFQGFETGSAV